MNISYISTYPPIRSGIGTYTNFLSQALSRINKELRISIVAENGAKKINDDFGHDVGDNALIEIANILTNTFRSSDIIGRIGGDEFAVLTTQHSKIENAASIRERLNGSVYFWNAKSKNNYNISLSFGIAPFIPNTECQLDDLLSRADDLMYNSKNSKSTQIRRARKSKVQ